MLPYLELHFENLILLVGYGLLGFLFLVLAHGADRLTLGGHPDAEKAKFADGLEEGHGGVPVVLVLLYAGLAVWAVLYVLAHALWGMDFAG